MIKRTISVMGALAVSAISGFANGVAEMSGTTFTQQLHSPSNNSSMLPMFAILFVGAMLLASMRRDQIRQAIPAIFARSRNERS